MKRETVMIWKNFFLLYSWGFWVKTKLFDHDDQLEVCGMFKSLTKAASNKGAEASSH